MWPDPLERGEGGERRSGGEECGLRPHRGSARAQIRLGVWAQYAANVECMRGRTATDADQKVKGGRNHTSHLIAAIQRRHMPSLKACQAEEFLPMSQGH